MQYSHMSCSTVSERGVHLEVGIEGLSKTSSNSEAAQAAQAILEQPVNGCCSRERLLGAHPHCQQERLRPRVAPYECDHSSHTVCHKDVGSPPAHTLLENFGEIAVDSSVLWRHSSRFHQNAVPPCKHSTSSMTLTSVKRRGGLWCVRFCTGVLSAMKSSSYSQTRKITSSQHPSHRFPPTLSTNMHWSNALRTRMSRHCAGDASIPKHQRPI